jgi:hypothetical protein
MDPETIEITECLKHWKRSKVLNKLFDSISPRLARHCQR